jgi:hypothetical protein
MMVIAFDANVAGYSARAVQTPQTAFLQVEQVSQVLLPLHMLTWHLRRFVPLTSMSDSSIASVAEARMLTALS